MDFHREPTLKALWIEQFVILCQEQDMTQAALKLGVSRQTLQRNLQLLEKNVGTKLIERNGKHFYITSQGRLFLHEAQRLVESITQLSVNLKKQTSGGLQGTLSLAGQSSHSQELLVAGLAEFMHDYPHVYIRCQCHMDLTVMEALLLGQQLDLAVVDYLPSHPELLIHSGRLIPYVIVSRPQPQRHWSSFAYIQIDYTLPEHVAPPWNEQLYPREIVAHTNSLNAVLHWAATGVAAYLPLIVAQPYIDSGQLAIVSHPPEETFKQFYLCASPGRLENQAVQVLSQKLSLLL